MESMSTTRFAPVDIRGADLSATTTYEPIRLPRKMYGDTIYCFDYVPTQICGRIFDPKAPSMKLTSLGPEGRAGVAACRQSIAGGPSTDVGRQNPMNVGAESGFWQGVRDRKGCPITRTHAPQIDFPLVPHQKWNESTTALAHRKC